jgi:hypothetical protein
VESLTTSAHANGSSPTAHSPCSTPATSPSAAGHSTTDPPITAVRPGRRPRPDSSPGNPRRNRGRRQRFAQNSWSSRP